jgi:hypothetical protein
MAKQRTATEGKAKQQSGPRADVHSGSRSLSQTLGTGMGSGHDLGQGLIEREKERGAMSPLSEAEFNA